MSEYRPKGRKQTDELIEIALSTEVWQQQDAINQAKSTIKRSQAQRQDDYFEQKLEKLMIIK
jgi:hypothetical protein